MRHNRSRQSPRHEHRSGTLQRRPPVRDRAGRAMITLPAVLGYTWWSYSVFRGKVKLSEGYH